MTEQDLHIIELYITGKLSREQINEVEARIKQDQGFSKQVVLMKTIIAAVRQQSLDEKRAILREEAAKGKGKGPAILVMQPVWRYVAVAAVLALAIFMIRPLLNTGSGIRNPYLAAHFDEFIIHDTHRGTGDAAVDLEIQKGYNLFVAKQFDEAVLQLQENWERHRDTISLFYLWVSGKALADDELTYKYEDKISEVFQDDTLIQPLIRHVTGEK